MALVLADRVKETTTTAGTGTITLAGAATGFQSFAAIGNGNTTYYTIAAQTGTEWEVGIGTYTAAGTTLSRDTVLSSSAGGAKVNFSAGTKDVFVTQPSSRTAYVDGTTATFANNGIVPIASGGTNTNATPTAGAVPYGTGTAYGFTAAGTSGQVLQSNGSSAPTWGSSLDTLPVGSLQYISGEYSSGVVAKEWYYRPLPINSIWYAGGYGNGVFLIAGFSGSLRTSTDTWSWTTRTSGTASTIRVITYTGGLYFYGGASGLLGTSTDAITWTTRTSGTTGQINSVIYGNSLYVFADGNGGIRTSTDGVTWTARTSGTASSLSSLTYGNGLYVYAGSGGVLATSTDAITWTARTSGTTSQITTVAYTNNTFLYCGLGGSLGTSTDAITWTPRTSGVTTTLNGIQYVNGTYVVGGNAVLTSTDLATWTTQDTPQALYGAVLRGWLSYGNGYLFLSGPANATASPVTAFPGPKWLFCDGSTVSGSSYPELALKQSGTNRRNAPSTWTAATSGTISNINALTYGNGKFVYAGDGGVLALATVIGTWTAQVSGTTSSIRALLFANNQYVYAGDGGVLATSTDAVTWTARTSGTTSIIRALGFGNGLYVYAGDGGVLATSTDAITWTARTSGTVSTIAGVAYGNGTYVYVVDAAANGAATSTNGITWVTQSFTSTTSSSAAYAVTFADGQFVATANAGSANASAFPVFTSSDGVDWTPRPSYSSSAPRCIAYGGGFYMIAGGNGTLQTSADSVAWTLRTSGTTSAIFACAYGVLGGTINTIGYFVYGGSGGVLAYSSVKGSLGSAGTVVLPAGKSPSVNNFDNGMDRLYIKASS